MKSGPRIAPEPLSLLTFEQAEGYFEEGDQRVDRSWP